MKHKPLRIFLLLFALVGIGSLLALASYSSNGRELLSLSYLNDKALPQAVTIGETVLTEQEQAALEKAQAELEAINRIYNFQLGAYDGSLETSPTLRDFRFKNGDVITIGTGSRALLLAGEAEFSAMSGAVVDTSDGTECSVGTPLVIQHHYLAAEQSVVSLTITSDTAVLCLEGSYALNASDSVDYNMLADAMKAMGLFKGSDTGYGSGYDLERAPTRIEALIMFLRLLGEEEAALATTSPCPFTDVAAWAQPYTTYAYEKGYTKGVGGTLFDPAAPIPATQYLTFVLRALGYSDSGETPDFAWDSALLAALQNGVLTPKEHKLLTEQPLLRAHVVYVSYYAMDANMKTVHSTLYEHLTSSGVLDKTMTDPVRKAVTTNRMM